jgi:hypothetical protein
MTSHIESGYIPFKGEPGYMTTQQKSNMDNMGPTKGRNFNQLVNSDSELDSGRLKRLILGGRELMSLFFMRGCYMPGQITIPVLDDIPDGCKIVRRVWEDMPGCFVLWLYHPSFEIVPPGSIPPQIQYRINLFKIGGEVKVRNVDGGEETYIDYSIQRALENQVIELRSIIDDMGSDVPPLKKMYEQGRRDAFNEIEDSRKDAYNSALTDVMREALQNMQIDQSTFDTLNEHVGRLRKK